MVRSRKGLFCLRGVERSKINPASSASPPQAQQPRADMRQRTSTILPDAEGVECFGDMLTTAHHHSRADLAFLSAESQPIFVERIQRRLISSLPSGKPRSTKTKVCSPLPASGRASMPNALIHAQLVSGCQAFVPIL